MKHATAMARSLALAVAVALFGFVASHAAPNFPALSGRVVDDAGILSASTRATLTSLLAEHEQQTQNQVVVVTVKSLDDMPIEQYGYQLGRAWGIGAKGKNNGALIIVSPNTHDVRIEVGYGLEGTLTDAQSKLIIENVMLPSFRRGDYDNGVLNGTITVLQALGGQPSASVTGVPASNEQSHGGGHISIIVILIILWFTFGRFFWPLFFLGGLGRRGGWGGGGWGGGGWGGSSGGGFSGGGGSFGGGGASGRW